MADEGAAVRLPHAGPDAALRGHGSPVEGTIRSPRNALRRRAAVRAGTRAAARTGRRMALRGRRAPAPGPAHEVLAFVDRVDGRGRPRGVCAGSARTARTAR